MYTVSILPVNPLISPIRALLSPGRPWVQHKHIVPVMLLGLLLLTHPYPVVYASFPPKVIPTGRILSLREDSFIVYNYTVTNGDGSVVRNGLVVLYVTKADNSSITYLIREIGEGDNRCSLLRGGALLKTYLSNGTTIVVKGSKPFIDFISLESGTTTVATSIDYYGYSGWGELSYIGSVLESADISLNTSNKGMPCKHISINPVDSNINIMIVDISQGKSPPRINTLEVLKRILPHYAPLRNLPYREGDYILYRMSITFDNISCSFLVNYTIGWINGAKIYFLEKSTKPQGAKCSRIMFIKKRVFIIDLSKRKPLNATRAPLLLLSPEISGNYSIRVNEEHHDWFTRINGWATYVKGILYAAKWRFKSQAKIEGNITVRTSGSVYSRAINSSIPVIERAIKHGVASVLGEEKASKTAHSTVYALYGIATIILVAIALGLARRRR